MTTGISDVRRRHAVLAARLERAQQVEAVVLAELDVEQDHVDRLAREHAPRPRRSSRPRARRGPRPRAPCAACAGCSSRRRRSGSVRRSRAWIHRSSCIHSSLSKRAAALIPPEHRREHDEPEPNVHRAAVGRARFSCGMRHRRQRRRVIASLIGAGSAARAGGLPAGVGGARRGERERDALVGAMPGIERRERLLARRERAASASSAATALAGHGDVMCSRVGGDHAGAPSMPCFAVVSRHASVASTCLPAASTVSCQPSSTMPDASERGALRASRAARRPRRARRHRARPSPSRRRASRTARRPASARRRHRRSLTLAGRAQPKCRSRRASR